MLNRLEDSTDTASLGFVDYGSFDGDCLGVGFFVRAFRRGPSGRIGGMSGFLQGRCFGTVRAPGQLTRISAGPAQPRMMAAGGEIPTSSRRSDRDYPS